MEQPIYSITDLLTSAVENATGTRPNILRANIKKGRDPKAPETNTPEADYGFNAFQLKENASQNIESIIADARARIAKQLPKGITISIEGTFINFSISSGLLAQTAGNIVAKPNGGITMHDQQKTMVEYFSPNTNKPAHLGHLRNLALGKSLSATLAFLGHDVLEANLTNDRGAHICKSMLAYQLFGEGSTPESTGIKGDHFVGDYYVKYEKALQQEIAPIVERLKAEPENAAKLKRKAELEEELAPIIEKEKAQQEADKLAKKTSKDTRTPEEKARIKDLKKELEKLGKIDEEIKDAAKKESSLEKQVSAMLIKWEAGDPETRALWEKMNGWVLGGFQETLKRMNVHFDVEYFESEIYNMGRDIVMDGLAKGIFERDPSGAVIADLQKLGIQKNEGKKVLLRSDGTTVYTTQDLAIAKRKMEEHGLDNSFYVVAGEQDDHFRALFGILKALGYEWVDKLKHMSYGMVELPEGRMKSREGTVVDVDDLLNALRDRVKTIAAEKGNETMSDEDADKIGKAAAQYYLLSVRPESGMKFDPEESVSFEGKTGPYILYQYVRTGKILEQKALQDAGASQENPDFNLLQEPIEHELLLKLVEFTEKMRAVQKTMDQTLIATYVYELAQTFSNFYAKCPVLKGDKTSPELSQTRLKLVEYTHTLLKQSLDLLAIETVDRM